MKQFKYKVWEFGNQEVATLSVKYDEDYWVTGFKTAEEAEQDAYHSVVEMLDRFSKDESYDGSTIDDYTVEIKEVEVA